MQVLLIISVLRIGLPHSVFKRNAILHVIRYSLVIFAFNWPTDEIQNDSISIFALVEIIRYDVLKNSNKL